MGFAMNYNIITKWSNILRPDEIFYSSPAWKGTEINGEEFMAVSKKNPKEVSPNEELSIFFFRKSFLKKLKY